MNYFYKIYFTGFQKDHIEYLFHENKIEKTQIETRIKKTFCSTAVIHEIIEYQIDVKSEINL